MFRREMSPQLGGTLSALVSRLLGLEERRQRLQGELEALPAPSPLPRVDWLSQERRARRMLADWRGLLARNTEDARPVLKDLLDGEPIKFRHRGRDDAGIPVQRSRQDRRSPRGNRRGR